MHETTAQTVTLFAEPIAHLGSLTITNSMLVTWIVSLGLILFAYLVTRKMSLVPSNLQNFGEAVIEALYNVVEGTAGKSTRILFPLVATFFFYILLNNWFGLLPGVGTIGFREIEEGHQVFIPLFRAGSSDLNFTLALAVISVCATQYYGIIKKGIAGYVKHYFHNPIKGGIGMVLLGMMIGGFVGLIEVISEFIKLVSLSFRLFGNIYAGEALLTAIAGLAAFIAPIPFLFLEIIVGILQATVFALLTAVFLSMITVEAHEGEH